MTSSPSFVHAFTAIALPMVPEATKSAASLPMSSAAVKPSACGRMSVDGSLTSQHVSGLLMALPLPDGESVLTVDHPVSAPYIDLTLQVMEAAGVHVFREENVYRIPGGQRYGPLDLRVEGDWSAAAFLLVAGAVGGGVRLSGLDPASLQGDRAILDVLAAAGVPVIFHEGVLSIGRGSVRAFIHDATDTPDLVPPLVYNDNVKVVSLEYMMQDRDEAIIWRGPLKIQAIRQFVADMDWGELDYLVVDLPPGTGDAPLSLAQSIPLTGAVVVCTPQPVALADAVRALHMYRQLNIEILGIVENMSYYICPQCGRREEIFGHGGAEQAAKDLKVPFLGDIPVLGYLFKNKYHNIVKSNLIIFVTPRIIYSDTDIEDILDRETKLNKRNYPNKYPEAADGEERKRDIEDVYNKLMGRSDKYNEWRRYDDPYGIGRLKDKPAETEDAPDVEDDADEDAETRPADVDEPEAKEQPQED